MDIKRLADSESSTEALFKDVFDLFNKTPTSPLFGLMSPIERKTGRISHVTFNNAMKSILDSFSGSEPEHVYKVLGAYLHVVKSGLRKYGLEENITNPTLFRALILLFPTVAERVADRYAEDYSVGNFVSVVGPLFTRLKKADLEKPGSSIAELHETFKRAFRSGFTIGRGAGK